jgi:hypothetical protein
MCVVYMTFVSTTQRLRMVPGKGEDTVAFNAVVLVVARNDHECAVAVLAYRGYSLSRSLSHGSAARHILWLAHEIVGYHLRLVLEGRRETT